MNYDSYQGIQFSTRIGRDARLNGRLSVKKNLVISGQFQGNIQSLAIVLVGQNAKVTADIQAAELVIAGEIHGNVECSGMVVMLPGSRIYGNIRTAGIRLAETVVFEGKCEMIRDVEGLDIFSHTLKDLRRAIAVENQYEE